MLEKSTQAKLQAELHSIEKSLKPIRLKTDFDKTSKTLKDTNKQLDNFKGSLGEISHSQREVGAEANTIVKNYKVLEDGTEKLVSLNAKMVGQYGDQAENIYRLKKGSQELVLSKRKEFQINKLTAEQVDNQGLAQKNMLTDLKGFREKDYKFLTDENLARLGTLEETVKGLDPASKGFKRSLAHANSEFKAVKTNADIVKRQISELNRYTHIWGQNILEAGKKFATWMIIATAIMKPVRILRQEIQNLADIDQQLVSLRKVTGETMHIMNDFARNIAPEIASRMGATTATVIEQTTAWARLGYTVRDAAKLAEESVMLSVVGNMSLDRATTALISTMKAFNMTADESRIVIDMVNYLPPMLAMA